METSGILLHVYMPKDTGKTLQSRRSLLLGRYSFEPADTRPRSERTHDHIIIVSIYGACDAPNYPGGPSAADPFHSRRRREDGHRVPHVLGQLGPVNDKILRGSQIMFTTTTQFSSSVWLSFDPHNILRQVFVRSHKVQIGNVIIFEYDPYSISRCIICQEEEHLAVPATIIESFGLVRHIPEDPDFTRMIPGLGERRPRDARTRLEADDGDYDDLGEEVIIPMVAKIQKLPIVTFSAGINQIMYRVGAICLMLRPQTSWIPALNILVLIMVDIFFGTLLTCYLRTFPFASDTLQDTLASVLVYMKRLLTWLSGAPAGLKLNAPLNTALYRFFAYNIDLWREYIGTIGPILDTVLFAIINLGYIGFTVQVGFIKDLLWCVTFHVYCIYIYAARLFTLSIYAVTSSVRLFLGIKWNPLRTRYDTVEITHSEMFMASGIFTVTVFLIPTTTVYYCVFLMLRLPILGLAGMLSVFIQFANHLELYTAYLVFRNSPCISDSVYFKRKTPRDIAVPVLRYDILTQTARKFYKIPDISQPMRDVYERIKLNRLV